MTMNHKASGIVLIILLLLISCAPKSLKQHSDDAGYRNLSIISEALTKVMYGRGEDVWPGIFMEESASASGRQADSKKHFYGTISLGN